MSKKAVPLPKDHYHALACPRQVIINPKVKWWVSRQLHPHETGAGVFLDNTTLENQHQTSGQKMSLMISACTTKETAKYRFEP